MVLGGGAAQAGPVLSTQSYYFGIPGTWAGLVAVITALFPKVMELHSPDRRSSPMTSFEQCLLAKAHLHLGCRFTSLIATTTSASAAAAAEVVAATAATAAAACRRRSTCVERVGGQRRQVRCCRITGHHHYPRRCHHDAVAVAVAAVQGTIVHPHKNRRVYLCPE